MCGIAGFIDNKVNQETNSQIITCMGDALRLRGPDGIGYWHNSQLGVNLAHRRLSIVDLTTAGHQPMESKSGRYIMIYNGEIYNFKLLKSELESICGYINWSGYSDTEVILHGFEVWGIEKTLHKCEGMFAIALWDKEEQSLFLIRDRIGEKPLYYGYFDGVFGFASELKSLKKHPKFSPGYDNNAIGQFMLHGVIPAPLSIYSGIYKLLPGHFLKLSFSDYISGRLPESQAYWELKNCQTNTYEGGFNNAVNDLDTLLKDVIDKQMCADVPLGCFLSGGIDSSAVAAIMQSVSPNPIRTFTIGFEDPKFDEAIFAKQIAKHIGTNHTELYISDKTAFDIIPKLSDIYDEPFADSSQIPTYLVSQLAKTKVTVSLSGDGGDEVFAGYNRYLYANKAHNTINKIPQLMRNYISKLLASLSPGLFKQLNLILRLPIASFKSKQEKIISILNCASIDEIYFALTSISLDHQELLVRGGLSQSLWLKQNPFMGNIPRMQYWDMLGYLPDDILVKVDRSSMANSLETRVPFLNHKIINFANSLPLDFKIDSTNTKKILREVLYKYVPKGLVERPKSGFAIPVDDWLRGELKDWACNLLSENKIQSQGYLNSELVSKKLNLHLSGKANCGSYLWNVLMFQQWLENQ